ncbi:MAG: ATP-binding cassette domain-containing protein [Bacteroidetes bacterium]|nr:ATP-binding cassette domain-containing protein [Bacteroidota bacterium]
MEQIEGSKPVNEQEPVLQVSHLYKAFGDNKVLNDFNLSVNRGERIVVLGKSGSGKSVLIKCIIGLLRPDSGGIRMLDKDIAGLSHQELDAIRAKVGFLFQSNALYDSMTVRENLEFPLRRHWIQLTHAAVRKMLEEALEDVGLAHTIDMMPAELSGGMRKRIALARTLILKPEIILYDEPTTGLDPITAREIIELMNNIHAKYNTTSLIISHDMNCVRLAASRIVVLINGTCYANGTWDTLTKTEDPMVKQFFE